MRRAKLTTIQPNSVPARPDKRNCPKCLSLGWDDAKAVRMEMKFSLGDGCESGCCGSTEIWQCPECKNIEAL